MKGLIAGSDGVILKCDVPDVQNLEAGWARIKVILAGVCSTDIHIVEGYKDGYQGILGHEFVGVIDELLPVPEDAFENLQVGDRVVGEINIQCTTCQTCLDAQQQNASQEQLHKKRNHCPNRRCLGIVNHNGTFAEYITLPLANLLKVPDNVPDSVAVFAEPVGAACRLWEQGLLTSATSIAVIGDGKLGILIAQTVAALAPLATIHVFGKHPEKLELLETFEQIQTHCVCSSDGLEQMESMNGLFAVTIEASGNPSGLLSAVRLTAPLGDLVLKTTCGSGDAVYEMPAEVLNSIVVNEIRVVGSRCGPMEKAIELLSQGVIQVDKLVSATYPLSQGVQAFEHARRRGVLKVLISMS